MVVEPPKIQVSEPRRGAHRSRVMDSASETVLVSHLLPNLLERVF
jgi:hypothetical protein